MGNDARTTPHRRVLVVTGDDFGLTPGVNEGIVQAHERGILTHASLMATGGAFAEAVRLAGRTPSLSVGVHLMLVDGRTCLPARLIPSLVCPDGRFRPTPGAMARDWVLGRVSAREVELEWRAQIERVIGAGIRPSHLDSHKHAHMWPPLFEVAVRLAAEYSVPAVRVAAERPAVRLLLEAWRDPRARRQAALNLLMAPLAWADVRKLPRGNPTPPRFVGLVYTGLVTPDRLARALRRLPAGGGELMTHPGFVDEALASVRTRLRAERERELTLLCAAETRELIEREGIQLAQRAGGRAEGGAEAAPAERKHEEPPTPRVARGAEGDQCCAS